MASVPGPSSDSSAAGLANSPHGWPAKYDVFGVLVTATDYEAAAWHILQAARRRESAIVEFMPVHSLMTATRDAAYRRSINDFDMVCPDGQPVRWCLNCYHHAGLKDRVYGPVLMLHVCEAAAQGGTGIYLYGSTPEVLQKLADRLLARFPALKIMGQESPPFRPLSAEEDNAVVERINASGAGVVFIGLGCPRQELFAHAHRGRIHAVQLCVGAAFDFHAGTKRMAPSWMQRAGLEWLFRLASEPGRLGGRYLLTNSAFLLRVFRRAVTGK